MFRQFGAVLICQTVPVAPESWTSNGHRLALEPEAISADPELPAFLKPPKGAPAYYGFPLLTGIEYDEFKLGMITDFIQESDAVEGDLYIVAPDGSRAGIVWCTGLIKRYQENEPPNPGKWGVWQFEFEPPLRTMDDAQWALSEMVPVLRPKWEQWAGSSKQDSGSEQTKRRSRWSRRRI